MSPRAKRASAGRVILVALALVALPVSADDAGPQRDDPLDARDLEGLVDDARAMRAAEIARERLPPEPIEGSILGARPGTRELAHDAILSFGDAIADVVFVSRIGNRGEHPTPVRLTWPLPSPFATVETEVCVVEGERCAARPARVEASHDAVTLALDALAPGADARFTLRVSVAIASRGGVARVLLPPRRGDVRVGATRVRVVVDGASSIGGVASDGSTVEVEASRAIDARAVRRRDGAVHSTLVEGRCGGEACAALHVATHPRDDAARLARLLVVVDASRSTEGDARNRVRAALGALRAIAPEALVRLAAFGEDATLVVAPPRRFAEITDDELVAAVSTPLGSTTRPDRAIRELDPSRDEAILVLGDGGFTPSSDGDDLARRLARSHADLRYLDFATIGPRRELARFLDLARARTIPLGAEADEAVRKGEGSRLREALAEALDPSPDLVVRGRSSSGPFEVRLARGRSFSLVMKGRIRASVGDRAVERTHVGDPPPGGEASRLLALASAELATPRGRDGSGGATESIPREIVQTMVRTQVIPKARGCLRDDRHGRARYSVRAELRFRFAEREVTDAEVVGALDETLRTCLLGTLAHLEVPRFEGAIRVTYPIRTLEAEEPVVYELDADVRDRVEAIGAPLQTAPAGVLEGAPGR